MKSFKVAAASVLVAASSSVLAAPFSEIRIGDKDGFGYEADANFASLSGDGGLIDRNGNGTLDFGEVLPSLNGNQIVATGNGDDFDNRLAETITGMGFTDNGTSGVEFTDIALSTSYDQSSLDNEVYNANTGTFGAGGAFPAPPSSKRPNQPGFIFDFSVSAMDILAGTDIYYNMSFADYEVTPAQIDFTFGNGSTQTISVVPQHNGPDDALIQSAYAVLDFNDVFSVNMGGDYDGFVKVDFTAPREPYTAFDFVELSVTPLTVAVSEPGSIALLVLGLAGLGFSRRRQS